LGHCAGGGAIHCDVADEASVAAAMHCHTRALRRSDAARAQQGSQGCAPAILDMDMGTWTGVGRQPARVMLSVRAVARDRAAKRDGSMG